MPSSVVTVNRVTRWTGAPLGRNIWPLTPFIWPAPAGNEHISAIGMKRYDRMRSPLQKTGVGCLAHSYPLQPALGVQLKVESNYELNHPAASVIGGRKVQIGIIGLAEREAIDAYGLYIVGGR